jgi:hypothetical protein
LNENISDGQIENKTIIKENQNLNEKLLNLKDQVLRNKLKKSY